MGNYNGNKEFDRGVAFTFYAGWEQDATSIEEDYGIEGYGIFCKAINRYALYEIEIDEVKKPPLKYIWNTVKEKIDASQAHRAKGFAKEDVELTEKIKQYKADNPSATQREIANALKCSVGKINKALKDSTSTNTTTITSTSTTVNVNANAHDSHKKEEKKNEIKELLENMNCEQLSAIKELYDKHTSYKEIADIYGLTYFDSTQFVEVYDQVYQKQYSIEHAEEIAKQKEIDRQIWEQEQAEREALRPILESTSIVRRNSIKKQPNLSCFAEENYDDMEHCKSIKVLSELIGNNLSSDIDSW